MNIAQNIRQLREQRGLSQYDLADLVGCSRAMISQIERGTKHATMELGQLIANALDCDIKELYRDGANESREPATA